MYVVLDLPSLYGYVRGTETAAGNAVICFPSSVGRENREPLLQNPHISSHYCCCQSTAKMFIYKNKGCIYRLSIAEPHCRAIHSLWIASGPCFGLSCSIQVLVCHALYHSLTCLSVSQQTASPNQQNAAAEGPGG